VNEVFARVGLGKRANWVSSRRRRPGPFCVRKLSSRGRHHVPIRTSSRLLATSTLPDKHRQFPHPTRSGIPILAALSLPTCYLIPPLPPLPVPTTSYTPARAHSNAPVLAALKTTPKPRSLSANLPHPSQSPLCTPAPA
jgi:hypothetical protein